LFWAAAHSRFGAWAHIQAGSHLRWGGDAVLGDVVADLKTCVADPIGCRDDFVSLMTAAQSAPSSSSREILEALSQGLQQAPGGCLTGGGAPNDPFCANPEQVLTPFRAQAQFNPDVAAVALVNVINTWARSNDFDLRRAAVPGGFFSQTFQLLVDLTPRAQSAVQARVILALQDLSGVQSVADLATSATTALQQIATQQQAAKQQQAQQAAAQQAAAQQQVLAVRDKKVVLGAVVGAIVIGGGAFLLGRWASKSGRRPRYA
jgi:hypothetical protein